MHSEAQRNGVYFLEYVIAIEGTWFQKRVAVNVNMRNKINMWIEALRGSENFSIENICFFS